LNPMAPQTQPPPELGWVTPTSCPAGLTRRCRSWSRLYWKHRSGRPTLLATVHCLARASIAGKRPRAACAQLSAATFPYMRISDFPRAMTPFVDPDVSWEWHMADAGKRAGRSAVTSTERTSAVAKYLVIDFSGFSKNITHRRARKDRMGFSRPPAAVDLPSTARAVWSFSNLAGGPTSAWPARKSTLRGHL